MRSNIHKDMAGLLKQAGILGYVQQPSEIEDEETHFAQAEVASHKGDVCLTIDQKEAATNLANKLKGADAKKRSKIDQLKQKLRHQNVITKYSAHPDVAALKSRPQKQCRSRISLTV